MSYFNHKEPLTPSFAVTDIENLYRRFGHDVPQPLAGLRERIMTAPDPHQVAARLALGAYNATDHDKYLANATREIAEAQAADALRKAFALSEKTQTQQRIPAMRTDLLNTIAGQYEDAVKSFVKAAKDLDHNDPLNAELALANDHGAQITMVRSTLGTLSAVASLFSTQTGGSTPRTLKAVSPLLAFPDPVVEQVYSSGGLGATTVTANPDEIGGTRTIRTFEADLRQNPDRALVAVAQGHYPGIAFATTPEPVNLDAAFDRVRVAPKGGWSDLK